MIKGVGQGYNPIIGQGIDFPRQTMGARQGASIFRKALEMEFEQATVPIEREPVVQPPVQPRQRVVEPPPPEPVAHRQPTPAENIPMERMIHEVTELAQDVGYLGFTRDDILRAYHTGESFFVDYTV